MQPLPREVEQLVAHISAVGLSPKEDERSWDHMGALITDAALQPRTRYKAIVHPRAKKVRDEWPDAKVLSGFVDRLDSEDLASFLKWRASSPKLTKIRDLATALDQISVETVPELAARFRNARLESETRAALVRVKHVGPKTLDYIAILTGSNNHVAVDQHVAGFVREAGVGSMDYAGIAGLVTYTAGFLKCSPGALDAAIWNYMSDRAKGES